MKPLISKSYNLVREQHLSCRARYIEAPCADTCNAKPMLPMAETGDGDDVTKDPALYPMPGSSKGLIPD